MPGSELALPNRCRRSLLIQAFEPPVPLPPPESKACGHQNTDADDEPKYIHWGEGLVVAAGLGV